MSTLFQVLLYANGIGFVCVSHNISWIWIFWSFVHASSYFQSAKGVKVKARGQIQPTAQLWCSQRQFMCLAISFFFTFNRFYKNSVVIKTLEVKNSGYLTWNISQFSMTSDLVDSCASADDMAPQSITDWKLHSRQFDFVFLQSLGYWFTNEEQNWLWSEKRTWGFKAAAVFPVTCASFPTIPLSLFVYFDTGHGENAAWFAIYFWDLFCLRAVSMMVFCRGGHYMRTNGRSINPSLTDACFAGDWRETWNDTLTTDERGFSSLRVCHQLATTDLSIRHWRTHVSLRSVKHVRVYQRKNSINESTFDKVEFNSIQLIFYTSVNIFSLNCGELKKSLF